MTSLKDVELGTVGVPSPETLPTDAPANQVAAAFRKLRDFEFKLLATASYHDRQLLLISACIDAGFNTRPRIVGTLHKLGYNRSSVAKAMAGGIGQRWSVSPDKVYTNLV